MITYRLQFNNGIHQDISRDCDADAMTSSMEYLRLMAIVSNVDTVHLWAQNENMKWRYIVSYKS